MLCLCACACVYGSIVCANTQLLRLLPLRSLCFVAVGELYAPKTVHNQRHGKSIKVLVVSQYLHASHAWTMMIIFILLCICDVICVLMVVLYVWRGSLRIIRTNGMKKEYCQCLFWFLGKEREAGSLMFCLLASGYVQGKVGGYHLFTYPRMMVMGTWWPSGEKYICVSFFNGLVNSNLLCFIKRC